MTQPTLVPVVRDYPRIGYCQKHASARFRSVIPADRHPVRRFRTSEPVDYDPSATLSSDGPINRYYDPGTDQFLTVDPLVASTGTPYAYTGDDPLDYTDPSGLMAGFVVCAAKDINPVDEGPAGVLTDSAAAATGVGTSALAAGAVTGWGLIAEDGILAGFATYQLFQDC